MTTSLVDQVKGKFPTVHITFLSVLVGFAIEDLFSVVRETESLYESNLLAVAHWLQVANCLMAITVAWLAYTLTAITRRAIPTPADSFQILAITATLFLMNTMIGAPLWQWNCVILIYLTVGGAATLFSVNQMEKENEKFRPFCELMRSWNGPLFINLINYPFIALLALGDYYEFIPLWVYVVYLTIGTIGFIVWISMVYTPWKKFLLTES